MPRPGPYTDRAYLAAVKAARKDPTHAERHQAALKQYLAFMSGNSVRFAAECLNPSPDPWAYHTTPAFVLATGRPYTAAARPKGLRKMPNKLCFRNAHYLALDDRTLTYTEGYALSFQGIPVEHAWCVRADGTVVDPTWYHPELAAYYGVEIPLEVVSGLVSRQGVYGILVNDWRNDCAILRSGRIELPAREETCA